MNQKGFTLIELIMVIVILGILAATAIPRFVDLSTEASQAAAEGAAGSLSAGSAIDYASCQAGATGGDCIGFSSGDDCADLSQTQQGGLDAAFTVSGNIPSCTVTHDGGGSATFTAIAD